MNKINDLMRYRRDIEKEFGNRTGKIYEAVSVLQYRTEPTEDDKKLIGDVLNLFLSYVTYNPIAPIIRDLGIELSGLINMYNEKYIKNKLLDRDAYLLGAILTQHITIQENIMLIKRLMIRMRNMSRFTSPAFEMSKAYLKSLKKVK